MIAIREPDGNVVVRSDDFALRFFPQWGGVPLEWWRDNYPLLTNSFPGSGASVNWDTGQDPTQATANGLLPNPIATLTGLNPQHRYYAREYVFSGIGGLYGVTGFLPDFWLSHEAIDDAIAPNPDGSDHGWRTLYNPGTIDPNYFRYPNLPVMFQGTPANFSGLFFVGNELDNNPRWNERLRNYGAGRIAFKVNVSLQAAATDSFAGFLFRKSVPFGAGISKHEAYRAPGLHLFFYRSGHYALIKMNNGAETLLSSGKLGTNAKKKLISAAGLQCEVRTFNAEPEKLELYLDNTLFRTITVAGSHRGPHFCLFASTSAGTVIFGDRRPYHIGVEFDSLYSAKDNGTIMSDITIRAVSLTPSTSSPTSDLGRLTLSLANLGLSAEPVMFYRTSQPGVFLNQTTFNTATGRSCAGLKDGVWHNIDGIYLLSDYESYWAGNPEGTAGVRATIELCQVDDMPSPLAHLLISRHQINDEFVVGLNALPMNAQRTAKKLRIRTHWQAHM